MVGAGFAAWVAGYTTTESVVPFPLPWMVGIGVAVTAAIGVWIWTEVPTRGRGKGPDFVMRWRSPRLWEVERVRPIEAVDVKYGDGIIATTDFNSVARASIGDLAHGRRHLVGAANSEGHLMPFTWREGDKRFYSRAVWIADEAEPVEITGLEWKPGETILT